MPSKQNKYKVQDVARDIGVDKAELLELLDKAFPLENARKSTATISADEVGYVLEVYSRKHEVENVMTAFASTRGMKTEKPVEVEKKAPPKKKPAAKKTETTEAEKPAKAEKKPVKTIKSEIKEEKTVEAKPEPKPESKPKTEPKAEVKTEPKAEAKPETKPEPKPETKPAAKPEPKHEANDVAIHWRRPADGCVTRI